MDPDLGNKAFSRICHLASRILAMAPGPSHHAYTTVSLQCPRSLTARASPAASMSCSFCVCFSWLSVGFTCAAPTVFVVHSSTSLCRSSVKVPFLLLLLFTCAWTCRVGWGPGSGPGARLLVEDPGESYRPGLVTPRTHLAPLTGWPQPFPHDGWDNQRPTLAKQHLASRGGLHQKALLPGIY